MSGIISWFASIAKTLYGLIIVNQAILLSQVFLVETLVTVILTAPLATLGLWSRSKQGLSVAIYIWIMGCARC